MTHIQRNAVDQRIRLLLHEPRLGDHHLGSDPLASQLTGPMRRDYRLRRFLRLAGSTAPDRRPTGRT